MSEVAETTNRVGVDVIPGGTGDLHRVSVPAPTCGTVPIGAQRPQAVQTWGSWRPLTLTSW
jgi:hypothetical protein